MAEEKKKNGFYQWNFDLSETDSDFTDIEYSVKQEDAEELPEIKPMIFVGGDYKGTDAEAPENAFADRTAAAESNLRKDSESIDSLLLAGTAQKAKEASVKTKTPEKKNDKNSKTVKSKNSNYITKRKKTNWTPLLIALAAILVIALLVILLWKDDEPEKAWTACEPGSEVHTLMDRYFTAKTEGIAKPMYDILIPDATVNSAIMASEVKVFKGYKNIELYQYPGKNKGEYAICAYYDTEFVMIPETAPTLTWYYARPDETGKLRLVTVNEYGLESKDGPARVKSEEGTYQYLLSVSEIDDTILALTTRANSASQKALEDSPRLAQYMVNLANGDIYNVPPEETSTEATTEAPTNPSVPESQSEATSTEKNTEDTSRTYCAYISGNGVRVRSTPSTESGDNILTQLNKGYYVYVVGQQGNWYHIKDCMTKNDATGAQQQPTGIEGWVSKDFVVDYYSQLN